MTDLRTNPNWQAAAQVLIDGCLAQPNLDMRVRLLEQLCSELGEHLYPAFLQILCVIEKNGNQAAQKLISETLVHALTSGRLPSGKLSAWGSNQMPGAPTSATTFSQGRSLGPIEYLCAWYAQPSGRSPLHMSDFKQGLAGLLRLFSQDATAKQAYATKLTSDVSDPLGGALSSRTRVALKALVEQWADSDSIDKAINNFMSALDGNPLERLSQLQQPFRF